jgi:hypothetical protein
LCGTVSPSARFRCHVASGTVPPSKPTPMPQTCLPSNGAAQETFGWDWQPSLCHAPTLSSVPYNRLAISTKHVRGQRGVSGGQWGRSAKNVWAGSAVRATTRTLAPGNRFAISTNGIGGQRGQRGQQGWAADVYLSGGTHFVFFSCWKQCNNKSKNSTKKKKIICRQFTSATTKNAPAPWPMRGPPSFSSRTSSRSSGKCQGSAGGQRGVSGGSAQKTFWRDQQQGPPRGLSPLEIGSPSPQNMSGSGGSGGFSGVDVFYTYIFSGLWNCPPVYLFIFYFRRK